MILQAGCTMGLGNRTGLGCKRRGARRWRKLEGSDPTTYEMILKVQALQRRLIGQTEAVAERELQLAEQGKGLAALRAALARQPGPEAIEQLGGMQARPPSCSLATRPCLVLPGWHVPLSFLIIFKSGVRAAPRACMFCICGYLGGWTMQADLRAKTKQLKALAGELSMNQARSILQALPRCGLLGIEAHKQPDT